MKKFDLSSIRSKSSRRTWLSAVSFAAGAALVRSGRTGGIPLLEAPLQAQDLVYQCPMDPDVRSNVPGVCPRCGMTLRAGIPEDIEFPMDFEISPQPVKAGVVQRLTFSVHDPQNDKQVSHFQVVHEKLFHMFVVSRDLEFFVHDHPVLQKDGSFTFDIKFPRPGYYRILGDYFPDGATPQLSPKSVIVPGGTMKAPQLTRDYSHKQMVNMGVSLTTVTPVGDNPDIPLAGAETRLFTHLTDAEGLEKYIGAWCHMMAVSDDMIDMIHSHPYTADGGPEMRFDVYFERARAYRVWFQWQKKGVINTAYFDIPVSDVES